MATKRDLGVSYLLGTGLGLTATLTWFFLISNSADLGMIVATVTAGLLSGTFVFIGYWMYHTGIAGDTVWTVARWSAIGLSVPVFLGITLIQLNPDSIYQTVVPGIFINLVAVGGVLGLLLGLVLEMHREQSDLRRLNRRNRVLNRVLRHNIRNDMSVMQFHVDMLADDAAIDTDGSIDALRRKIDEVVSTSDTARRIDELDSNSQDEGTVDIVGLIEERIGIVRRTYQDVTFQLDLPEQAYADVGPIFASVIDNVVENAIKHTNESPNIEITVEPSVGTDVPVHIQIADDGPGIPDSEVEMLETGEETQLKHGTGLGLWLVKWVIDHYGGEVRINSSELGGTCVVLEVPPASDKNLDGVLTLRSD